jgi:hypothetical protein
MTLYKSEQTYFAAHLLHGCRCAHQELLSSYPAIPFQFRSFFDAKLLNRCFASTYKYYTKDLHAAVAKPTYAPSSSSPIEDRFIAEALKIPAIGHLQTSTLERVLLRRN